MFDRHLSPLDRLLIEADKALRSLTGVGTAATNTSPAENCTNESLDATQKRHAAGLMRVNHSGEICAQALYQGQALTAKLADTRAQMDRAAAEEMDHLAWCEQRLQELDSRPSVLNPLWYGLSFAIGASAGLISDRLSLGFVAATEEQVCQHLQSHLQKLPAGDQKSRAVVEQMLRDESEHAETAKLAGGVTFPGPVKKAMTLASTVMTRSSYIV